MACTQGEHWGAGFDVELSIFWNWYSHTAFSKVEVRLLGYATELVWLAY